MNVKHNCPAQQVTGQGKYAGFVGFGMVGPPENRFFAEQGENPLAPVDLMVAGWFPKHPSFR